MNLNVKKWTIKINCDDSNGGGGDDFSQEYVIMHQYFGKNQYSKK